MEWSGKSDEPIEIPESVEAELAAAAKPETSSDATPEAMVERARQFREAMAQGLQILERKLDGDHTDPEDLLELYQAQRDDLAAQMEEMSDSGDAYENLGGGGKEQTTLLTKMEMEAAVLNAQIEELGKRVAAKRSQELKRTGTEG